MSEAVAGWVLYGLICGLLTVAIIAVTLIALTEGERWWDRIRRG